MLSNQQRGPFNLAIINIPEKRHTRTFTTARSQVWNRDKMFSKMYGMLESWRTIAMFLHHCGSAPMLMVCVRVCVCKRVRAAEFEPSGKDGRVVNPCGWRSWKAIHIFSWLNHILSSRCPVRTGTCEWLSEEQNRNVGLKETRLINIWVMILMTPWLWRKVNFPLDVHQLVCLLGPFWNCNHKVGNFSWRYARCLGRMKEIVHKLFEHIQNIGFYKY